MAPHLMPMKTRFSGFTLIELLVVVAIIGLIASTVVASLNTARFKAQDAAIREQAIQLRTVMEQEFNATGSYAALQAGGAKNGGEWYGVGDTCSGFSGQFAQEAINTCTALVRATGTPCGDEGCVFFASVDANGNGSPDSPTPNDKYSIMAYLQGTSRLTGQPYYLCVGSSGKVSVSPAGSYTAAGCWSNP